MEDATSIKKTTADGTENDLEFYFKLAKPLILNLPHTKDQALSAAWAKKIRNEKSSTIKLRTDYMKLLLMVLQRSHLIGIFADDPEKYGTLEEFPEQLDLNDFAKLLIEKSFSERQERIKQQLNGHSEYVTSYITDCSADQREYVAVQDIPGFGVHCYYAISEQPISKWRNAVRGISPMKAKSEVDFRTYDRSPAVFCICAPNMRRKKRACAKKVKLKNGKDSRSKKWGLTPPILPIGICLGQDDRIPPNWGTNLTYIKAKPQSDKSEQEEEILYLSKELGRLEQFLDEYKCGKMTKNKPLPSRSIPKTLKPLMKTKVSLNEFRKNEEDEPSPLTEEIINDSYLIEYLKEKLSTSTTQRRLVNRYQELQTAIPAKSLIPVTTPRQSPIPKRPALVGKMSRGCGTERICSTFPSVFSNSNVDNNFDAIDRELAMWIRRLKELEQKCEEAAKQIRYCKDRSYQM